MVKLPRDFREFLDGLNARSVNYLVVGGYAVTFYGYPRHTGDIDIWVQREQDNAKNIVAAIKEFGFDTQSLKEESFLLENYIAQLGLEPMRIELFTHIPGLHFDEAFSARNIVNCEGTLVPFLSIDDLRKAKIASGRIKDLADLEHLPKPPLK